MNSVFSGLDQFKSIAKFWLRNCVKAAVLKKSVISSESAGKRVAICYIGEAWGGGHSNFVQQGIIANSFKELGYTVDVYENECFPFWVEEGRYDIVFGFGVSWRYLIGRNKKAIKVLYGTEAPPFFSYVNECFAIKRSGGGVRRSYRYYVDDDYLNADWVLQMGGNNCALVRMVYPNLKFSTLEVSTFGIFPLEKRVKKNNSKKFIWFGSSGVVHKGLDLYIQCAIKNPNLKFYVAGCSKKEFDSLTFGFDGGNLEYVGFLDVTSVDFLRFMDSVSFLVLPSASEGISTAVITCMYAGLIPIVTKAVNVECNEARWVLPNFWDLDKEIKICAEMSDIDFVKNSVACQDFSYENYSVSAFENSIKSAVSKVME